MTNFRVKNCTKGNETEMFGDKAEILYLGEENIKVKKL